MAAIGVLTILVFGTPAAGQTGLDFNGSSQYVTFGEAADLGNSTFTLEVWFYRQGTGVTASTGTGGVTAIPLLTKGRGEADGNNRDMNFFLGIRSSDNVLCADYEEGTGQTSPGLNHPVVGTTSIRNDTWYHAAATFDGTTWRLYLNGVLDGEVVVGAGRLPQSASIQHAALATALNSTGTPSGYFDGILDEPRVWDHARSQNDIATDMTAELTSGTGLVGRWGLNEGMGTNAANSIGGGVDGTLTNGPAWVTGSPFAIANSLALGSSNAYVTFGNPAELGLAQFTIETWFRRDGTGTAASTGSGGITALPLVTKGAAEVDGDNRDMNYFLGIRTSDNVLAADFEEGAGGSSPGLNHPIAGVTPLSSGVWYHAAATYDGTTWRLYLNGVLENELAVGQPPQSGSIQPAGLGTTINSTNSTAGFFDGTLDEVRIWDYARDVTEIGSTINDTIATPMPGLVARWSLDEGAGSTVNGSAGTTATGTITGSGWNWAAPAPFDIVIGPPQPPDPPSDLLATAPTHNRIDLSWTDNSNNELNFEIERSTSGSGGPFTPLVTLGPGVMGYADTYLDASAEYCYRVRATNHEGESAWSDVACQYTLSQIAGGLDFGSGSGYTTFGDPDELDLAEFTIECWFRRDGTGSTANTGTGGVLAIPLVTKGVGEAEASTVDMNWFLGIRDTDDVLAADFEEGAGGASPGQNHPVTGSTPISTGVWYHAAATYDGTTWRLYLNGVLDGELTVGQPPQSASIQHAGLAVALNSSGSASGHLDGVLDEVRVWDHARTESEIRGTINSELSIPTAGLVARWNLDEGAGADVYGSAGTAVTGSIINSGWSWTGPAPFNLVFNDPPAAPTLNAPADMATGVVHSPTLDVTVTDNESDPMTVTFYGRPVTPVSGSAFSIIHIPDTQYYTSEQNGGTAAIFQAQIQWVVDNLSAYDIAYLTHVGDCAEHGDTYESEWINAELAMSLLENPATTGLAEGLPYNVTVGNHDQTPATDPTGTTTYFNQYFGESRFSGRAYYGGHYAANNDNHFGLFSAGGLDFIVISMEYDSSPDVPVLAWAESLLVEYPNRWGIISTHNLLGTGNPASFSSQGQATYDALKDNPNLFLMLCGHAPGEGRRSDTYDGHTVHTLMADYQSRSNGGDGWLRIVTVDPTQNALRVQTYSPTLDQFETDADSSSQFTLSVDLQPLGDWQLIGTVADVPSGSNATVQWSGLDPLTEYEWYATVDDGNSTTTGPTWTFTTRSESPTVQLTAPNGGETLTVGDLTEIQWIATDDVEVTAVDLYLSRDGSEGSYETIATGLANSGSYDWSVAGDASTDAFVRVVARDGDGSTAADTSDASFTIVNPVAVEDVVIAQFALDMLSANPVRGGGARFAVAVPRSAPVRVTVYDVRGRETAVLVDGVLPPGEHEVLWSGQTAGGRAGSGVYFVRMQAPGQEFLQRVVLLH